MSLIEPFLMRTRIAYFSMEMAIRSDIPTYAGGLGVLAGDTARSAADLELPMVFVTLVSREGYLRQEIDNDGRQVAHPDTWDPAAQATPLGAMVAVTLERRVVWIRPWLHIITCPLGHRVPIVLLDTRLDQNAPEDRAITDQLYGDGSELRLKQEAVLGVGGEAILNALGFTIETYHLNEGHAALLPLSLLRRHRRSEAQLLEGPLRYDVDPVRERCIFTTHTPVEAGHDRFDYEEVVRILGDFFEIDQLRLLAGDENLNMTRLALSLSAWVNGVASRHAETAGRMFPGYHIRAVTNGVHVPTWAHPAFARLFQDCAASWGHDPEALIRADRLPDDAVRAAKLTARNELLTEVQRRIGKPVLRADLPTFAFARRMTGYKRPDLLFSDVDRLRAIGARYPFQILFAGKAHPADGGGQELIQQLHAHARTLAPDIPTAFVPGYDMRLAQLMVAGADVWLNTPLPPMEASGTSGMKAALNGGLNLSVLDGWWLEACEEGVTGWSIGQDGERPEDHARDLYAKLENTVLPLWHSDQQRWTWMMRHTIARIGARFNSQRMMRRYAAEAYLR
jgi:glycogen phosphorylase